MVSPSTARMRTLLISRRVREGGFSAQAALPKSWFTRERIRSMLSATMKSEVRESPSGVSVAGISYVASSVNSATHSRKRHASRRAASSNRNSSISARVVSRTVDVAPMRSLRDSALEGDGAGRCGHGARHTSHQRMPLAPEGPHLQLVVRHGLGPVHTAGDVGPFDLTIGEASLTRFQRFDVVRRGEPTRTQEGQKVVEAQRPVVGALVPRRQGPGIDLDVIRRDREECAHGDGHNVVDDEVGKDEQVATGLRHLVSQLGAKPLDELLVDRTQLGAFRLAEHRRPLRDRPSRQRLGLDERVTIAQGFSDAAAAAPDPFGVHSGLDEELEVPLMSRARMIPIDAVLDQKLPVGAHAVSLGARNDLQAALGLVAHQIEAFFRAGEIRDQRLDRRREAHEDEITIDVDPRRAGEPELLAVERSAVGVLSGHADESTVGVERPGVIEALERLGVAAALSADLGATVRTGVQEDTHHAIPAAHEDEGTAGDAPGPEISRLRDLGRMAGVDPALFEDAPPFQLEDARIGEYAAVHPEHPGVSVIQHQTLEGLLLHGASLQARWPSFAEISSLAFRTWRLKSSMSSVKRVRDPAMPTAATHSPCASKRGAATAARSGWRSPRLMATPVRRIS